MGCDGHLECLAQSNGGHTLSGLFIPRWDCGFGLPGACQYPHVNYKPQWGVLQCHVGVDPGLSGDIRNLFGCDVGCVPCADYPDELFSPVNAPSREGKRWLHPDPSGQPRNASGAIHDLPSNTPVRVPSGGVSYLKAPCWDNYGIECFGSDSCECFPASFVVDGAPGEPQHCANGEECGALLEGLIPDLFGYTGTSFFLDDAVSCRRVREHGPLSVSFKGGALHQAILHRTIGCAANFFIPCSAKVSASECQGSFLNTPRPNIGPPVYYNESPSRQDLDTLRVLTNSTSVGISSPFLSTREKAEAGLKNTVLSYIAARTDVPNFQQLNHDPTHVEIWKRVFTGAGLQAIELPVVPNTNLAGRLTQSRCPVSVQLRLVEASIELNLVMYQTQEQGKIKMTPYARLRIRAVCIPTVTTPIQACSREIPGLENGGQLFVINGGSVPNVGIPQWPRVSEIKNIVTTPALDTITYLSNDVVVTPPGVVEWWGMLGSFSDPKTQNLWPDFPGIDYGNDPIYGTSNSGRCKRMAHVLSDPPLKIPAWPYGSTGSTVGKQVYKGAVEISFL